MQLFNRRLVKLRKARVAESLAQYDFLLRESGDRLTDRLYDMQRDFPLALEIGAYHGILAERLTQTGKIRTLIQGAITPSLLADSKLPLVMDAEHLPIAAEVLDAVISNLSLHSVNDLVGALIQIRHSLKPDGLFLAVMPGPRTLQELRESILAVSARTGKAAPRISPFVEVRDAGALLQRAGFALPVIDSETLTLTYANPLALLRELQHLGETNCLSEQHRGIPSRHFWPEVFAHYQQHYSDARGRITATLELVFMTAWSPHESQQKPAPRGSGKISLKQVL